MRELDRTAIREIAALMRERKVPNPEGEMISLLALPNTRQMIEWMEENPEATIREMWEKAKEIGENA